METKINKIDFFLVLLYLSKFDKAYEEMANLYSLNYVTEYNGSKNSIPKAMRPAPVPRIIKPKPSNAYEHEAERHKTLIRSIHRRG
ncbi:MAG: hypothetical protein PHS45_02685 [Bacilli bacterium]|nr:hypothetical protein [Bacilli bacterium]